MIRSAILASMLFLGLLFLGLLGTPAFAHSGMVKTSIHDQQKFAAAPPSIVIRFDHDSAVTALSLMSANKKPIALAFKPSKAMVREASVPLPPLGKGAYILSWKSVAKDGHPMPGAIRFTITGAGE